MDARSTPAVGCSNGGQHEVAPEQETYTNISQLDRMAPKYLHGIELLHSIASSQP